MQMYYWFMGNRMMLYLVEDAQSMEKAGNQSKVKLWVITGKGHSDCHEDDSYWNNVLAFLEKK